MDVQPGIHAGDHGELERRRRGEIAGPEVVGIPAVALQEVVDAAHGRRDDSVDPLRLIEDSFPDDPALDTSVSRALLERVAAGASPETLRLARPGRMVAFGKQDAVSPSYNAAVHAAREAGFEAVLRLAGGRAAVFHEGTIALAQAIPDPDPRPGIHERFERSAQLVTAAL